MYCDSMDKAITINLTMPKILYKRYVKLAKRSKCEPIELVAYALVFMIEPMEKAEIKRG